MSENYIQATVYWCPDCQGQHTYGDCPMKGICKFCKERPATLHFGDMLSITHSGTENCCQICCLRQQLEHARERAKAIPELESELTIAISKWAKEEHERS